MWNPPTIKQLQKIPKLYSQEDEKDPKVYMKFFLGPMTWYATEYDPKQMLFFGWVINDNYPDGAELGYFSLKELMDLRMGHFEVDREIHGITPYSPKKLSLVKKQHMAKFYR